MTPSPSISVGVSSDSADVAAGLLRSVVLVNGRPGSGSGVIWRSDGLIITNSHVVNGDAAEVVLRDGSRHEAHVVARDARQDLAALRIDAQDLPTAQPGDSSRVHVGQIVLAVGNPLGMRGVVTAGIVTGVGQVTTDQLVRLRDLIQADVMLAPGNSGGPLADAAGRVLGINTMISAAGIALAIPVAKVQVFLSPIVRGQPYLGITAMTVQVRPAGQPRGALLLTAIDEGSPAERAGLLQGDVLLGFDGQDVENDEAFISRLAAWEGDAPVRLHVLRGHEAREFTFVPTLRTTA